jgi:uncharacterized Ntn-hydrolase superfamily protein
VTFSIIARSPDARMFGMAIASSSPAVAARCAHALAGVGVVATQNITDPALGPQILRAIAGGATSESALASALHATPHAAYRQLLVLGATGPPAAHTGAQALGVADVAVGADSAAAGNLLERAAVPAAMVAAFEAACEVACEAACEAASGQVAAAPGHFGARLLDALRAGADQGGEAGPVHSAGLLIVREVSWPIVDLRVDWSDADPIVALTALWDIYAPQIEDYVRRALDPGAAPSFGVPGSPIREPGSSMRVPGGPMPDSNE